MEETISWRFQRAGTSPGGPVTPDGTRVIVGPQTLSITNVALEDAGAYTCQASNALVEPILTSTRLVVEGKQAFHSNDVRAGFYKGQFRSFKGRGLCFLFRAKVLS